MRWGWIVLDHSHKTLKEIHWKNCSRKTLILGYAGEIVVYTPKKNGK
jgi:hypothetical protein